jgi:hypothetical protein
MKYSLQPGISKNLPLARWIFKKLDHWPGKSLKSQPPARRILKGNCHCVGESLKIRPLARSIF